MKILLKTYFLLFFLLGNYELLAQNYAMSISGSSNLSQEEGEAQIVINPLDSNKMVMGYMELDQGTVNFKVYTSNDAGNTWQVSSLNTPSLVSIDYPAYSIIGGGDIVFAYDKLGSLYCSWIHLLANTNLASPLDSCIWTGYWAKSADNGQNFSLENGNDHFFGRGKLSLNGGISVYNFEDGICDRQWMAVDLSNGPNENNLYIGFINYPFNLSQTGLKVKTKPNNQSTFSVASSAYQGSGQLTNIAVDSSGVLHYTFCDIASNSVYHISSNDGGQNFTAPHLIYSGSNLFPQSNHFLNDRENAAPSLTIDGENRLHLVWGDFPANQLPNSYYSHSTDLGVTWSNPISLDNLFYGKVFMPVISSQKNRIAISGNVVDTDKQSVYQMISSNNNGLNFSPPVTISSGMINFDDIGISVFVGDYSSGARTECSIFSVWTDCSTNGCKQYIAKFNECQTAGIAELTPIESSFSLNDFYPNPFQNNLNLVLNSDKNDALKLNVFNKSGQLIYEEPWTVNAGENNKNVNLEKLSSGSYILKLSDQKGVFITRQLIKN